MNSYFEKLTTTMKGTASNNNTASPHFLVPSPDHQNLTLPAALDRIDELRTRNCQLEIDLKCEHDEKADLVSIKVGLENEVVELREVNERLEFQVQQLRVEKDNIHHVLATFKEGHEFPRSTPNDHRGILMMMTTSATSAAGKFGTVFFSAEAGSNSTGGSGGAIKRLPSLDDLLSPAASPSSSTSSLVIPLSPCVSPTPPGASAGVPARVSTPCGGGAVCLERINEEDETILESLVMNHMSMSGSSGSGVVASTTTTAQSRAADDMMKRLAYLESENARLSRMLGRRNKSRDPMNTNVYCPTCSTRIGGAPGGVIFDHDDEGLVLTAVDDDEDDEEEHDAIDNDDDDPGFEDATVPRYAGAMSRDPTMTSSPPTSLTEMQRKIMEKMEEEVIRSTVAAASQSQDEDAREREEMNGATPTTVATIKEELEKRMNGIVMEAMRNRDAR